MKFYLCNIRTQRSGVILNWIKSHNLFLPFCPLHKKYHEVKNHSTKAELCTCCPRLHKPTTNRFICFIEFWKMVLLRVNMICHYVQEISLLLHLGSSRLFGKESGSVWRNQWGIHNPNPNSPSNSLLFLYILVTGLHGKNVHTAVDLPQVHLLGS